MVSPKIYLFATLLLVSESHSQLTCLPQGCGAMRPTGQIISLGEFFLPAVVRTVLPSCSQPRPTTPLAPVAPVAPVVPVAPVAPVVPVAPVAPVAPLAPVAPVSPVSSVAPSVDFDEEDPYDDLLLTLITTFLDSKNPGKKYGKKGKSYDIDEDEFESISPYLYCPAQPAGAEGGAPGADAPSEHEFNIIVRLVPDPCVE